MEALGFIPQASVAGPCWNLLAHNCDRRLPGESYGTRHVCPEDELPDGCSLTKL